MAIRSPSPNPTLLVVRMTIYTKLFTPSAAMLPTPGAMPETGANLNRMLQPLIASLGFRLQFCSALLEYAVRSYAHNVLNVVFFQCRLDFCRRHSRIRSET